jgi:hypothetical protein
MSRVILVECLLLKRSSLPFFCYSLFKVPLKAEIMQILFSQIHQIYAKYTFEIFIVDGITIAYQIESIT